MVLDLFSKYGWIVPLKDKKGETVTEAFKTIFKEGRKPQYLWTDKGKEYYNKNMKELLGKNNITLYSTENEEKSSVCVCVYLCVPVHFHVSFSLVWEVDDVLIAVFLELFVLDL